MGQNRMKYKDTCDTPKFISLSTWNQIQQFIRSFDAILSKLCQNRKELDFAESRYYRINQILLSIVQLWPYTESTCVTVNRIFIFAVLTSITFFQLTTFLTFEYTTSFVISVLRYLLPYLWSMGHYYFFCTNLNKMKEMWSNICEIWSNLKDEKEYSIMVWYTCLGELFTIGLILTVPGGIGIYTLIQFSPFILDIILPLNEPRPFKVYALTEYFIDDKTYYYPMLCHWLFALYVFSCNAVATGSFLIIYIQQICGLLKITSYRIKQAIDESTLLNLDKKDFHPVQRLRAAVNIHREALKRLDFLVSTMMFIATISMLVGSTTLCLNLFELMRALHSKNMDDLLITIFICYVHFFVLFIVNYYGQEITNYDSSIFKNAYEARWYAAPIHMQKLLLFVMKKTMKPCSLNIGNILIASMETFNNVSKMIISYFTIFYSFLNW